MKVLVLAPPMQSIGGIQRYTRTLIRALRELFGEQNVRVLAIPPQPKPSPGGQERLERSAKARFFGQTLAGSVRWRPDLILCAHVGLSPLGRMLRLFASRQYWVIAYGIEVWGTLPFWKRQALARADRLLAISDFTRQEVVRRYGLPADRAVLLPPVVERPRPPEGDPRAAIPVPEGRPIVLTVGRLDAKERYKGHDVVLQAWRCVREVMPNAVYLVVGDGDDRLRLEAMARQLGLGDAVVFARSVSDDALAACYEACDVFAMPARTMLDGPAPRGEGFGIVFLEAMAHGKPVVGPQTGAPAEFIRHGEHGVLVNPEDPAGVAQALIDLLASPERARRMGQAAREWALREFGYARFCERLRQAFNESG